MNFGRDVGQIQRFFYRRIATTYNGDFLITVEETVAGSAGGNAFAFEGFFCRQAKIAG
ncbi:hypothetical protein D3C80_1204140 [compost metagenome]